MPRACLAAFVTALLLAIAGCETTDQAPRDPGTFMLQPDEERIWERARESLAALRQAGFVIDDPMAQAYLESICKRLYPEVDASPSEFEVLILRDPSVNAFALPNGVVCVNTGLLSAMESEAQIAIVLAHELIHFHQRHSIKQFRHLKSQAAFHNVFMVGTLGYGSLISLVGFPAAISGHSKAAEREADALGWNLYRDAGYAAEEAPLAFRQLQIYTEETREKESGFFGSHPRLAERLDAMTQLASEAHRQDGHAGHTGRADIFPALGRAMLKNALIDMDLGNYQRVRRLFARMEDFSDLDNTAAFMAAKAELLRLAGQPESRPEALALCRRGLSLDPLHPGLLRTAGQLYMQEELWQDAAKALRDALSLDPEYPRNPFIRQYLEKCEAHLSNSAS